LRVPYIARLTLTVEILSSAFFMFSFAIVLVFAFSPVFFRCFQSMWPRPSKVMKSTVAADRAAEMEEARQSPKLHQLPKNAKV
jgi:hypothetical protein